MVRLMSMATRSGCSSATSRAAWPTTAVPSSSSSTALGVSISLSRLGTVSGWPWSFSVATAQNVVPRSIPIRLPAMRAGPSLDCETAVSLPDEKRLNHRDTETQRRRGDRNASPSPFLLPSLCLGVSVVQPASSCSLHHAPLAAQGPLQRHQRAEDQEERHEERRAVARRPV